METVFQIIGVVAVVAVIIVATVFFGIPAWIPGEQKPNRETMMVIGVILGLIVCVVIGAVLWENFLYSSRT